MHKKTELLLKAISFASKVHEHHYRKDAITPYVSHPVRVAFILRHIFGIQEEAVLCAAVLHDTIEDTTTDFDDLHADFGREITAWVSLLSKDKRLMEEKREAAYLEQLRCAPDEVKIIKLADIYDNVLSVSENPSGISTKRFLARANFYLEGIKKGADSRVLKVVKIVEKFMSQKGKNGIRKT